MLESPLKIGKTPIHSNHSNRRSQPLLIYPLSHHHIIMAPSIPEKQWAQVIEKTGGPVEYKQIPGRADQPMSATAMLMRNSRETRPR